MNGTVSFSATPGLLATPVCPCLLTPSSSSRTFLAKPSESHSVSRWSRLLTSSQVLRFPVRRRLLQVFVSETGPDPRNLLRTWRPCLIVRPPLLLLLLRQSFLFTLSSLPMVPRLRHRPLPVAWRSSGCLCSCC